MQQGCAAFRQGLPPSRPPIHCQDPEKEMLDLDGEQKMMQ